MISMRTDAETMRLLDELARPGETRSDTIRRALEDAARFRRREQMRSEAEACATDPDDLRESAAVRAEMDGLGAG